VRVEQSLSLPELDLGGRLRCHKCGSDSAPVLYAGPWYQPSWRRKSPMMRDWLCHHCYSKPADPSDKNAWFSAQYELQRRTYDLLDKKVRKIKQSYKTMMSRRKNKLKELDAQVRAKVKELRDLERDVEAAIADLAERVRAVQELSLVKRPESYPEVPPPSLVWTENGEGLPESAGVYFIWKGGQCVYIGQSLNLKQRCSGVHERINSDDRLSYVCLDPYELTWAENFYIGVMRPRRNYGRSASHYRFRQPEVRA